MNAICSDALIDVIRHEISHRAPNKAKYPFNLGLHDGQWIANIEVNSIAGTFDIEAIATSKVEALTKALTALRRQYSRPMTPIK